MHEAGGGHALLNRATQALSAGVRHAPRDGRPTQRNGIYLARGVDGVKTRANVTGGLTGEAIVDESGGVRNSL